MKMSEKTFNLIADLSEKILANIDLKPEQIVKGSDAWWLFHECHAHTSYDDNHPRWKTKSRLVESAFLADFWHESSSGLNAVCSSEGLNDAHIKTALQKIFPNAVFQDSYHY